MQLSQEAQQEMKQQLMELASPMKPAQASMSAASTPTKSHAA
jgi:hypothetical protein